MTIRRYIPEKLTCNAKVKPNWDGRNQWMTGTGILEHWRWGGVMERVGVGR